jgi:hypothetical protein
MNPITTSILEILKYVLPSIIVLIAAYLIIKKFLTNDIERQRLALFGESTKIALPLRLQAYERLSLFLERMNPQEMMSRFYHPEKSAMDVQLEILYSVRSEFEHNLTQQIYVSNEVWKTVVSAKEQEISMINQITASLPVGATAKQLFERITEFVVTQDDESPREIALAVVNGEAKRVLFQG